MPFIEVPPVDEKWKGKGKAAVAGRAVAEERVAEMVATASELVAESRRQLEQVQHKLAFLGYHLGHGSK